MVVKRKGFKPELTHYRLKFTDSKLNGLEVVVSSMRIRKRLEFDERRFAPVTTFEEITAKEEFIAATLASVLVEWDLLDPETGQPVPMTVEGILGQHPETIQPIVNAWLNVITAVPDQPDPTQGSLEDSIPMMPLEDSIPL